MKFDLQVFEKDFEETFEKIIDVILEYFNYLFENRPEIGLRVEIEGTKHKEIWKGYLEETKRWGSDDIVYGHIEIPAYNLDLPGPKKVKLFCAAPEFLVYWTGLADTLLKHLKWRDVSLQPVASPWDLIPDYGYDRTMVKMWHKGYSVDIIGTRIDKVPQTVYNRLGELRKKYGETIIPYRKTVKNLKKPQILPKK